MQFRACHATPPIIIERKFFFLWRHEDFSTKINDTAERKYFPIHHRAGAQRVHSGHVKKNAVYHGGITPHVRLSADVPREPWGCRPQIHVLGVSRLSLLQLLLMRLPASRLHKGNSRLWWKRPLQLSVMSTPLPPNASQTRELLTFASRATRSASARSASASSRRSSRSASSLRSTSLISLSLSASAADCATSSFLAARRVAACETAQNQNVGVGVANKKMARTFVILARQGFLRACKNVLKRGL